MPVPYMKPLSYSIVIRQKKNSQTLSGCLMVMETAAHINYRPDDTHAQGNGNGKFHHDKKLLLKLFHAVLHCRQHAVIQTGSQKE